MRIEEFTYSKIQDLEILVQKPIKIDSNAQTKSMTTRFTVKTSRGLSDDQQRMSTEKRKKNPQKTQGEEKTGSTCLLQKSQESRVFNHDP